MRTAAALGGIVLVLAGAGAAARGARSGDFPPPAVQPAPAVVPDGYRVRRLTAAGFSLAFPPGWQVLAHRDAVWPGVAETLGRVNPRFAPLVAALTAFDSPLELFGFDRRAARGDAVMLTVLRSRQSFGPAYAAWSAGVLRTLRALPGGRGVRGRRLAIPAGEALLVETRRSGSARLRLFAVRLDTIFTLTLDVPAADLARYRTTFLRVARSLDLSVPILHP